MRHLGAVGCQPSIYSQQCGLQTAGVLPTRGILGLQVGNLQHLQPAMRATNNMGGANMRHLGAVGWQPTAFTASNVGPSGNRTWYLKIHRSRSK